LTVSWPSDNPGSKGKIAVICAFVFVILVLPIDTWGALPGPFIPIACLGIGWMIWSLGEILISGITLLLSTTRTREETKKTSFVTPEQIAISMAHSETIPNHVRQLDCSITHHADIEEAYMGSHMQANASIINIIATIPLLLHDIVFPSDDYPIISLALSTILLILGTLLVDTTNGGHIQFQSSGFAAVIALLCIIARTIIEPWKILVIYGITYSVFYYFSLCVQCLLLCKDLSVLRKKGKKMYLFRACIIFFKSYANLILVSDGGDKKLNVGKHNCRIRWFVIVDHGSN